MTKILKVIVSVVAFLYVAALGWLYVYQDGMVFNFKSGMYDGAYTFPQGTTEVWLDRPDGARLHGAVFPATHPKVGALLYFRGNAGNLEDSAKVAGQYTKRGYDVLTMDYRGFGLSEGDVSEANMLSDAEAWYDYAAGYFGGEEVRVLGYSLGSTMATHVAAVKPVENMILYAPMKSVLDVGQRRFPFIPDFVSRYPFRSDLKLPKVSGHVHIFHGDMDQVVPLQSGRELEPLLGSDDSFTVIRGANHGDLPYRAEVEAATAVIWPTNQGVNQAGQSIAAGENRGAKAEDTAG